MISSIYRLLWIVTLVFFTGSCYSPDQHNEDLTTTNIIEQVRRELVPDKRDNIFDIKVKSFRKLIVLKGETSYPAVKKMLDSLMNMNEIEYIDSINFLPDSSVFETPQAIVRISVANLREKTGLGSELLNQVIMGQTLELLKKEDSWYLVKSPDGYFGWVYHYSLAPKTDAEIKKWKQSEKLMVTKIYTHIYEKPSVASNAISDLVIGNKLKLVAQKGNFYQLELPDGRIGFTPINEAEPYKKWLSKIEASPENIVKAAKQFLGVPYMWGGASAKFFDCSGFTQTVYKLNGIQLTRDASQQIKMGIEIDTLKHFENLQLGDLLFFGRKATENTKEKATHVAIYIGDTEYIHAAGLVKINSLDPDRENYSAYRKGSLLRAKRILKNLN